MSNLPMGMKLPGDLADRVERAILEKDLHEFVRASWHIVEPGRPFVDGWHVGAICEHLQAIELGQIKRLAICISPRSSKSTIVSAMYPAWVWATKPETQWLCLSHAEKLAVRDTRRMRFLVQSKWYQSRWQIGFARDENLKHSFLNDAMGSRGAYGMTGQFQGEGADRIILDDPQDRDEAYSATALERAIDEYREKVSTRLNNPATAAIIAIAQRLAAGDLLGYLMDELEFERLVIPMRYEPNHPYISNTGWQDPRTEEGELMCPERFPEESVKQQEKTLGVRGTAGQLQQRPAAAGGEIFKTAMFRYFQREVVTAEDGTERELLTLTDGEGNARHVWRDECFGFQTCDTAQKIKEENDWTVVLTALITPEPACLLIYDVARVKLQVPQQYDFLAHQRSKNPWVEFQAVEDKASGIGLIQQGALRGKPFMTLKAETDKVRRAVAVTIWYENGLVYHLAGAAWLGAFEDELTTFPLGQNDDQADTLSYSGIIAQNRELYGMSSGGKLSYRTEEQQAGERGDGRRMADRLAGSSSRDHAAWAFGRK